MLQKCVKNDVFVATICNCKIRYFLSRKFANARSALALRDIWRYPNIVESEEEQKEEEEQKKVEEEELCVLVVGYRL